MKLGSTKPGAAGWGIAGALAVMTLLAYLGLWSNGFVRFDDQAYITDNPFLQKGLTVDSIVWAFSLAKENLTYWHPLTWLSLMFDHEMFGLNPAGYHLVNLLFHFLNVVLLFSLLRAATTRIWSSAFAAALFALHPLNVEAVAWAVERKTVLSAFLCLLTVRLYIAYVNKPGLGRYLALFGTFALALMAKSVVVTIPFALLVLDFWPLGRIHLTQREGRWASMGRLIGEKLPLLALSLALLALTIISNRTVMHTAGSTADWGNRIANALVSYVAYLGKLVWPADLAVYYPLQPAYPVWQVAGAAIFLAGLTGLVILQMGKRPWLAAGWFWYLGVMFPAIGLVRNGLWPAMADRFAYLPLIGLYIMIAWGCAELSDVRKEAATPIAVAAGLILVILAFFSQRQVGYWRDTVTLFDHAATVTSDNLVAYNNLGHAYLERGDLERAFAMFSRERDIDPANADEEYARARLALAGGDTSGAIGLLQQALLKNEHFYPALELLESAHEKAGDYEQAVQVCNRIIYSAEPEDKGYHTSARNNLQRLMQVVAPRLAGLRSRVNANPADLRARGELALKLDSLGLYEEALTEYGELERQGMKDWQLSYNMGNVQKKLGRYREAVSSYEKALAVNPGFADGLNNLGIVLRELKEPARAKSTFERAIAVDPNFPFAPFQLAMTYLQMGDRENARRYFLLTRDRFPQLAVRVAPFVKKLEKETR